MARSLEGVLASIPGLGGYSAQEQFGQNQTMGQLSQLGVLSQLRARMEAEKVAQEQRQREEMVRGEVASSGGDLHKAVEAMLRSGNVKGAASLAPLIEAQRKATPQAQSIGSGGLRLPDGSVVPPAARPSEPKEPKPPAMRTRIEGDQSIQEEFQPDGTWKRVGGGARFAKQVPGQVTLTTQGTLDKEAVTDLAIQSLYDPNATQGYRRDPKMMAQIANERVRLMREGKVTSEDVVSGRAGFKADTASLNKITPQYDAITAFEKTAVRNGEILKDLAVKADTTGVPVVERWIRAGRTATGDTDVSKFNAQMNLYRAEAARILTQPNLSGVLTDTARKEMEEVMRNSASAKQIIEVVDLLKRDFNNRRETLEEQIASIRARMRSRASPGGSDAIKAPDAPAAKPATPAAPAAGGWKITPIQ